MNFLKSIFAGTLASLVVLLVLVALVWLGGAYLEWTIDTRIILTCVILGVWFLLFLVLKAVAVRRARAIEDQLRAQAQEQTSAIPADTREQIQDLQKRFREALQALKNSRLGKSALYAMPWYVLVGPPGSGKSTALLKSGLNFPSLGQGPRGVKGIGGTRNCDWWFTEEGIFLDTAGRYTTQSEDHEEWLAFLNLLARTRRDRPINGAIVTVSVPELLDVGEGAMDDFTQPIRERLDELCRGLDVVFPTYVVFSKTDLVEGFSDFFDGLDRDARNRIFGSLFDYPGDPEKDTAEIFEPKAQSLYDGLHRQRIRVLAAEKDPDRARNIYLFPTRFALLQDKVRDFLGSLFRPNPFQESSPLRGFFFTSATQTGESVDPLAPAEPEPAPADAALPPLPDDLPPAPVPAPKIAPAEPRSYFLNHLFSKVILPDCTLVRLATQVSRRLGFLHGAVRVISIAALTFFFASFLVSFVGNRNLLEDVNDAAQALANLPRKGDNDPRQELLALETLRSELSRLEKHRQESPPLTLRWGLYQGYRIESRARELYFSVLKNRYLEPSIASLEDALEALRRKPKKTLAEFEHLYELFRAYLMLTGAMEPDAFIIREALEDRKRWWEPVEDLDNPRLETLAGNQLDYFLTQLDRPEAWELTAKELIVAEVRKELTSALWITKNYRDMIDSARDEFPPIVRDDLYRGPHKNLFHLQDLFSGIYTEKGWNDYVQHAIQDKSEILSRQYAALGIDKDADIIADRLQEDFLADHRRNWDNVLKATRLRDFTSVQDAADVIRVLSGPESPYPAFLESVRQLQSFPLGPAEIVNPAKGDLQWLPEAQKVLAELHGVLDGFLRATRPGRRFVTLLREDKLAAFIEAFHQTRLNLSKALLAVDASDRARMEAFLGQPIDNARRALAGEAQDEMEQIWRSTVYDFFVRELEDRYPVDFKASEEIPCAVFSKWMNPNSGLLWETYALLETLHNTIIDSQPLIVFSGDFERAVRHARTVRDAFYASGSGTFAVPFSVTLKQFAGVRDVRFRLGEQTFSLYERPDKRGNFTWTENDAAGASIAISVGLDQWVKRAHPSPWGLLRLLKDGDPAEIGRTEMLECRWTLQANILGRVESFQAGIVLEPSGTGEVFRERFFGRLTCPESVGPQRTREE